MLKIKDNQVYIYPGHYESGGHEIIIGESMCFHIPPSPVVWIENEPVNLSPEIPQGFAIGTRLAGPTAWDINALGALIPDSLIVRKSLEGEILKEGHDYLLSADHALLGIGPESCVRPEDTVYVTYAYSMMRLDSIFLDSQGDVGYTAGIPHITTPHPPRIPETSIRLANIFCPYRTPVLGSEHIYPVLATSDAAPTATQSGRLPSILQKLQKGKHVDIVCWGDSVTAGGNASENRYRYVDVFADGLRRMFPTASIEVHNISVGGSCSANWLYPEQYPFAARERQQELDFSRIIDLQPDLLTQEFVNDAGLGEEMWKKIY
ncbi:MAG: DUF4815 domain-containing protein [Anaerolineae bacterium]|nr:DUF4815 domain-containing protein [Anaerolineae bacterium]